MIYLAEYNQPDEPVPVDMMIPLLLNLPISLPSTCIRYMLVQDTSFSAAKTSLRHSLEVVIPRTGFSISNSDLVR